MRAITAPNEIYEVASQLKGDGRSIGLVPTMGAIHDGHLSLIERSINENDYTIVSLFVNPLQFDKEEDLLAYPRTIEEDKSKLADAGVDYLFIPDAGELYSQKPATSISFGKLEKGLEGQFRPGHFSGVAIVVSKLFHLSQPTKAYFGLKDLQQFLLIRRMVEDLSFPIQIVGVETKRETSGLAMSSRNKRLSDSGKGIASNIITGLRLIADGVSQGKDLDKLRQSAVSLYQDVEGLEVEYLEVVDGANLEAVDDYHEINELAICFAGYVEGIRLIDNLYLRLK